MFDTVGRTNDDEATKRSLTSLLITSLLCGATSAFVIGFGAMTVVTAKPVVPPDDDDFTEYVPVDLMPQIDAPPPPAAAAAPAPTPEVDPIVPEPDELDERIRDLSPVVPLPLRDQPRPIGALGGVDGGEDGGQTGGRVGGVPDGTGGHPLGGGGGIRRFHHNDLQTRSKPTPRYPRAAEQQGFGNQACSVDVSIDEKGIPFRVEVSGCPDVFAAETRKAILRWRWYAPKDGRDKIKARTTLRVVYKE